MGTRAIHAALEHLRKVGEAAQSERISKLVAEAEAEVLNIERAAAALIDGDTEEAELAKCEPAMERYLSAMALMERIAGQES